MDHKASLNTSFLELSSTIQGRNQGKETTQHQCLCNQKNGGKEIQMKRKKIQTKQKQTKKITQHNLYIQNKEVQKNSQGILILRQMTIKHSLQSVMYTWH